MRIGWNNAIRTFYMYFLKCNMKLTMHNGRVHLTDGKHFDRFVAVELCEIMDKYYNDKV